MAEFHFEMDLTKKIGTGPIDVRDVDELHYRFIANDTLSSAVVTYLTRRDMHEPGLTGAVITTDGTAVELDVSGIAYIDFQTTTTEASRSGDLFIYTRRTTL